MKATALQMLLEIQHIPSTPPSPASHSISSKYLLIFIYILCPRCPAPVRSHLLALFPPASSPPPPLNLEPGVVCGWQKPPPGAWDVGGSEAGGPAALGRAGAGRAGAYRGGLPPHCGLSPIWDRFSKTLCFQRLLEGTDGCQMPGAQSPREDPEGREEGEWDRCDREGDRSVLGMLGDYSSHSGSPQPWLTEEPGKLSFHPIFSLSAALIPSP